MDMMIASERHLAAPFLYTYAAAAIAAQKQKDDPKLIDGMQRIEARVGKLASQQRPAPLPIQCAPGKARMDAVNAGADK